MVGNFHKTILGHVKGWRNHDKGYDLENNQRKIIAEIKNKHNTMNVANQQQIENELGTALKQKGANWTAYLVAIIPKTPQRYKKQIVAGRRSLFIVDGASFYEVVTGSPTALHDLYVCLQKRLALSNKMRAHCDTLFKRALPR